jgi:hypothetical protein
MSTKFSIGYGGKNDTNVSFDDANRRIMERSNMIEINVQYDGKAWHPFGPTDQDESNRFKRNQICIAKIKGTRRPRSYAQLCLFWKFCEVVSQNTELPYWKTKEQVAEQCKVGLNFVDMDRVVLKDDGEIHIPFKSISFANLDQMEADKFFDRAFAYILKKTGIDVNQWMKVGMPE